MLVVLACGSDHDMDPSAVLMKQGVPSSVKALVYPGGRTSDISYWYTHTHTHTHTNEQNKILRANQAISGNCTHSLTHSLTLTHSLSCKGQVAGSAAGQDNGSQY